MNIVIKNRLPDIEKLLESRQTLSVLGMPGAGISVFLHELSKTRIGHAVYVDVFGLPVLSGQGLVAELARQLDTVPTIQACSRKLEQLSRKHKRVAVYFGGFDQLENRLDGGTIQALLSLVRNNPRLRLVFGLCVSLGKLIPDAHFDSALRLLGNTYYLGTYSPAEMKYWLGQFGPAGWRKISHLDQKIELAGGHLQLLLVLLANDPRISDQRTESANLLFKNMYQLLLGPQRTVVRAAAAGKTGPADEYLAGIGMLTAQGQPFSPLFGRFIRETTAKSRLPHKEQRLFLLLKKHLGRTVPKNEIIDIVWQGQIASEWALNALVYRLRRHPVFTANDFVIESHKKLGYRLIKAT